MSEPVTAPSPPVVAPSRPNHSIPAASYGHGHTGGNRYLVKLAFGALGVVYGDIGTSPLYSMRECFAGGMETTHENILGVLSLISWSLIIMVSLKYIAYVLRADNKGEGGILALMALSQLESAQITRVSAAALLGRLRLGPALRRRHDHAGDLGVERGRGSGDRSTPTSSIWWCRSRS